MIGSVVADDILEFGTSRVGRRSGSGKMNATIP